MMKTSTTKLSESIKLISPSIKGISPVVVATLAIKGQQPMWHEQYNKFDSINERSGG
jgi:hypothetical protein